MSIFLALLCYWLALFAINMLGGTFIMLVGGAGIDFSTGMPTSPNTASVVLNLVFGVIANTAHTTVLAALAAVAYVRIRGIREEIDTEAMSQVFS